MLPGNFKELVQETGAELVWVARSKRTKYKVKEIKNYSR